LKNKATDYGVPCNGMTFAPNFMQIYKLIHSCILADMQRLKLLKLKKTKDQMTESKVGWGE
jgi:BarA-like signal transduction histidine kinase